MTLHVVPLSVNVLGAVLVVPVKEPLKPGAELKVAPAAMDPLYEALVTVTALPVCVNEPFQSCVIVCPLANENWRLQPFMALVPVLLIVSVAPKPVDHWLVMA